MEVGVFTSYSVVLPNFFFEVYFLPPQSFYRPNPLCVQVRQPTNLFPRLARIPKLNHTAAHCTVQETLRRGRPGDQR